MMVRNTMFILAVGFLCGMLYRLDPDNQANAVGFASQTSQDIPDNFRIGLLDNRLKVLEGRLASMPEVKQISLSVDDIESEPAPEPVAEVEDDVQPAPTPESFGSTGTVATGYGSNGYQLAGYGSNGTVATGYGSNGYQASSYRTSYGSTGYQAVGYGSSGYSSANYGSTCLLYTSPSPRD